MQVSKRSKSTLSFLVFILFLVCIEFLYPKSTYATGCQNSIQDNFVDLNKWTTATSGTGNTLTTGSFFGQQAVKHTINDPNGYTVMKYILCQPTHGKVIIDFYDDGSPKGTLFYISSQDTTDTSITKPETSGVGAMAILSYSNPYPVDTNSYIYRVHNAYNPTNSTLFTGITRKVGWHTFELVSTPVGTFALLDGINLTWMPGKKTDEGFTYSINTQPLFLQHGIKSVNIISTWFQTGNNYFANLRFTPTPPFNYTNSNESMAELAYTIAKYALNLYPNVTNIGSNPDDLNNNQVGFYTNIFAQYLGQPRAHGTPQEYWPTMDYAGLLAYDFLKTGNTTSLETAKKIFRFSTIRFDNNQFVPWNGCNDTTAVMTTYIPVAQLLWTYLDTDTKAKALNNIYTEAQAWLNMRFDTPNINLGCVNPWDPQGANRLRNFLPFARLIGNATERSQLNSANRDNAWTASFLLQAGNFSPLKTQYPAEAGKYIELGKILAYHSVIAPGDPPFGSHPVYGGGPLTAYPTFLSNFNNPTVWSTNNSFYSYVTLQMLTSGVLSFKPSPPTDLAYYHHWADVINRADQYLDFTTFRSKSSIEGVSYPPVNPPTVYSQDEYGRAHEFEDLSNVTDTLAGLTVLPGSFTGVSQSTYRDRLFALLKYEFYTLDGYPRFPWYADGSQTRDQAKLLALMPQDGWGDWGDKDFYSIGVVRPTTHLFFVINSNFAWWHIRSALYLQGGIATNPTPSPSPSYTIPDLKTLLQNFLSANDSLYKPVENKVNLLDAGWVVKWITL